MIELSFVTERNPGSQIIRWFTHSIYSHVDIILSTGQRLGARSDCPVNGQTGVQIREADYAKFTCDDRLQLDLPAEAEGYEWLVHQIGKPYDITGLYASFLFSRSDWRGDAYDGEWWCSELAQAFAEHCGVRKARIGVNRFTPNDAYLYLGAFAR